MTNDGVRLHAELDRIAVPEVNMQAILRRGQQIRSRRRILAAATAAIAVLVIATAGAAVIPLIRDATQRALQPADRPSGHEVQLAAFLDDDLTYFQVRDIVQTAHEAEGVLSVEYVSKDRAFEEFQERYRDKPEYWENLPSDALPAFVAVRVSHPDYLADLRSALQSRPGVDQIVVSGNQTAEPDDGAPFSCPDLIAPGSRARQEMRPAVEGYLDRRQFEGTSGYSYRVRKLSRPVLGGPEGDCPKSTWRRSFVVEGSFEYEADAKNQSASLAYFRIVVGRTNEGWIVWAEPH